MLADDIELKAAVERYRQHINVLNGPATVENFSRSPYFKSPHKVPGGMSPWWWDGTVLRADQSLLAKECLTFYED